MGANKQGRCSTWSQGSNDIIMAPPVKVQDDGTLKGLTGLPKNFKLWLPGHPKLAFVSLMLLWLWLLLLLFIVCLLFLLLLLFVFLVPCHAGRTLRFNPTWKNPSGDTTDTFTFACDLRRNRAYPISVPNNTIVFWLFSSHGGYTISSIVLIEGRNYCLPRDYNQNMIAGTYRLGLKRAFELFPKTLVGRMKRERRKVRVQNPTSQSTLLSLFFKQANELVWMALTVS